MCNTTLKHTARYIDHSSHFQEIYFYGCYRYLQFIGSIADCAEMVRSQHRFSYVASKDRLKAASLKDCSNKCSRETYCNTFSFRSVHPNEQTPIIELIHCIAATLTETASCPLCNTIPCCPKTSHMTGPQICTDLYLEAPVGQDTIPTTILGIIPVTILPLADR